MSKKIIGIDIRENGVCAVLLKSGIKGSRIEAYVYVPISAPHIVPPASEEEAEKNQTEINPGFVAALETIKNRMDTTGAVCIASLPANLISYRNIRLPFKDAKKIRQILPFEIETMLPFPVDDLILDFQMITNHQKQPDSKSNTEIITAAVEKSRLKSYLDILIRSHLEPETITVGGYPVVFCLNKFADVPENWLFADIDEKKCTIFAVVSGQVSLIRSFPIRSTSEHMAAALCADIQRTLSALEEIFHSDIQPRELYISGYGLNALQSRNFEREVEYRIGVPVKEADICRDANVAMKMQVNHAYINNPLALALMEMESFDALNFRRGEFAPRRQWAENKGTLIRTMILLGLIVGFVFLNIMTDSYSKEKQLNKLDKQITEIFKTTFPEITRIVDPLHQMRVAMDELKKNDMLPGNTNNIRVVDILNEISTLILDKIDVEFTQTIIAEDNVQISGETDSFNSVDSIQSYLEKSTLFKKVTIANTSKKKIGNQIQFKIRIQLTAETDG